MRGVWCYLLCGFLAFGGNPTILSAQDEAKTAEAAGAAPPAPPPLMKVNDNGINYADTAWMLTSSALVLMMTAPGLALFYGGLVRKKNVLSVMMQCIFLMGSLSVIWALFGYSLAFGDDLLGGFVGDGKFLMMNGVMPTWDADKAEAVYPVYGTIPRLVHMVYQGMFFIITPALICGAFAERMKFSAMLAFLVLWGVLVYCPIAHWVWSDTGWLNFLNANAKVPSFDFAGGTVVHLSSGVSALICAMLIGKRLGFGQEPMPPHNLTYTCIGAALLWVGWFGFNAGSALTAGAMAANAFVATHLAAAAGVVSWAGLEWIFRGKPTILGACSGAVAGLVCVTPACGFVSPLSGIWLGLIVGAVCYWSCSTLKAKCGYDDSLDAFGVHGVGGTLGALLTGVFATRAVTGHQTGPIGLLEGNSQQIVNQAIGAGASAVLAIVGSLILLKVIDAVIGLRVTEQQELQGLDVTQHGEEGYIFL